MKTTTLLVMLFAVAVPPVAFAQDLITLLGDTHSARLDPASGYTIERLEYDGFLLVDPACGSCQGTVIHTDSWYGSCHGGELVQSISLWVDGVVFTPAPGETYVGTMFRLDKRSTLGGVVSLESRSIFTDSYIRETAHLVALEPVSLAIVYPFLSTHSNALTGVMAVLVDGTLFEADTSNDDDAMLTLGSAYIVAQHSADYVVATHWPHAMASAGSASIWDRSCDNKLYHRFVGYSNPVQAGTEWSFTTTRFPMVGEPTWHMAICPVAGDLDRDGDVDLADFSMLQVYFGHDSDTLPEMICADFDNDGTIGLADFAALRELMSAPI